MEKFYTVTNQKFLEEIEAYKKNRLSQDEFIKRFFAEKGIKETGYCIRGNGRVNTPFEERNKSEITLYVESSPENDALFASQLKKERTFNDGSKMREFRKNSPILKAFQDLCIKEKLVINVYFHREGDYFKELSYGGYSVTRFEYDGNYYLKIEADQETITPVYDGFVEIKGSEFYAARERLRISRRERQREGYQRTRKY